MATLVKFMETLSASLKNQIKKRKKARSMNIHYIKDSEVGDKLDRQLRDLLSICFTKPGDEVFKLRRYFKEYPAHRWYINGKDDKLIAHTALHEKMVVSSHQNIPIGGIAEVCVHPDFRGQGLVRRLLKEAHDWLILNHYPFSLLFGDPRVYSSSGYITFSNLFVEKKSNTGIKSWEPINVMVCRLLEMEWPESPVYLQGPTF